MDDPGGNGDTLRRLFGPIDGAALIVSNVVGVGIFTVPGVVAGMVAGPRSFAGVWIVGGLLALAGGLVYAELGRMRPRAGGEYVYITEALGPLPGFLSGWTSLVAGFSGAVAAGAVGFAAYLDRLVPGAGSTAPLVAVSLGGGEIALSPRSLVALALVATLTLVHLGGLGPGRAVQNLLAAASVVTVVALVAAGVLSEPPGATPLPMGDAGGVPADGAAARSGGGGAPAAGGPVLALVLVMFTYSGWNAATYVAGEVREPGKTLLRATLLGLGTVAGLYLGLNVLYLRTLGLDGMVGGVAVADRAAALLFGPRGARLVALVVLLALASGVSAMILTGPRVYFAMARDGGLPAWLGRVGPESGVPGGAVVLQGAWSAVLLLSGSFEALLTFTGFAVVLFSGLAVASYPVLLVRDAPGGGPAPGRRLVPCVLFLAGVAVMLVESLRLAPGPSLAGAALIAAGIPVHVWASRRSRRGRPPFVEVPAPTRSKEMKR